MATVEATGSGDWSAVIPVYVAGDTVKPASYTVAIDQNITIPCILDNTSTAGGFTVAAACTIAATLVGGTAALVVCNHTTGTVAITGNVTGGSGATCYGVNNANAGTLTIAGNVLGGANATAHGVYNTGAGAVSITGNVTGSGTASGLYNALAGVISVSGIVTGGSAAACYGIHNKATGTIAVTGSVVGGTVHATAYGLYSEAAGTVTISGAATGSALAPALYNAGAGTVTIGSVAGGSGSAVYGVHNNTTGTITITGNATGGSAATTYGAHNAGLGSIVVHGKSITGSVATALGTNNAGNGAVTVFTVDGNINLRASNLGDEQVYLALAASTKTVVGTRAASGSQPLVGAPAAGKKLAITYCRLERTTAVTTAVVATLLAGATTIERTSLADLVPVSEIINAGSPLQFVILPAATALNLGLGAAYSTDFVLRYLVLDAEQS